MLSFYIFTWVHIEMHNSSPLTENCLLSAPHETVTLNPAQAFIPCIFPNVPSFSKGNVICFQSDVIGFILEPSEVSLCVLTPTRLIHPKLSTLSVTLQSLFDELFFRFHTKSIKIPGFLYSHFVTCRKAKTIMCTLREPEPECIQLWNWKSRWIPLRRCIWLNKVSDKIKIEREKKQKNSCPSTQSTQAFCRLDYFSVSL